MNHLLDAYKNDWILFTEASFIAINRADEINALRLIAAAEALNSEQSLPKIARGYLRLHKLELKEAIRIYDEVLQKEPDNELAKTLLGVCLGLMPNGKDLERGEKILTELARAKDPLAQQTSATALNFVHRFVKKEPGPAGRA
ncbi:MAG: hypothetical protein KGI80_02650 [Verrucomicrobiota bacterium]|nr:hypothetical protein [Verrucomicrobiota bacterium]